MSGQAEMEKSSTGDRATEANLQKDVDAIYVLSLYYAPGFVSIIVP